MRPSWSVRMKTEREKSVISSNFQDGKKWIRPCFVVAFFVMLERRDTVYFYIINVLK